MAGTFLRKKENFSMFLEDTVNGVPVKSAIVQVQTRQAIIPMFNQCRYLKKLMANEV